MIAPIGFDETEEQYIARLEAEIARQAASHGSAGGEKQASDAPVWYAHAEAHAWADGYNAALSPPVKAETTDPLYDSRNPNHGRTGGLADPAQAVQGRVDLTDEVVDAALSEYWDLSPRSWNEAQRVGMRKAILSALGVSLPSAHRGGE